MWNLQLCPDHRHRLNMQFPNGDPVCLMNWALTLLSQKQTKNTGSCSEIQQDCNRWLFGFWFVDSSTIAYIVQEKFCYVIPSSKHLQNQIEFRAHCAQCSVVSYDNLQSFFDTSLSIHPFLSVRNHAFVNNKRAIANRIKDKSLKTQNSIYLFYSLLKWPLFTCIPTNTVSWIISICYIYLCIFKINSEYFDLCT